MLTSIGYKSVALDGVTFDAGRGVVLHRCPVVPTPALSCTRARPLRCTPCSRSAGPQLALCNAAAGLYLKLLPAQWSRCRHARTELCHVRTAASSLHADEAWLHGCVLAGYGLLWDQMDR